MTEALPFKARLLSRLSSGKRPFATPHPRVPPNPSVKGTPTSGLRPLAVAPYVER
jgi:hypothetical protein